MPEELNRIIVDHCSNYLSAPKDGSRSLLLNEGIESNTVFVTGNTVVDAVFKNIALTRKEKIHTRKTSFETQGICTCDHPQTRKCRPQGKISKYIKRARDDK
jgi:UDP-N-acetylglucosamine 2-epimerase